MNVMQQPGPDLLYDTVLGPRAQIVRPFLGLHLYLAERFCKNSPSTRDLVQCKSVPGTTWLVSVIILCTVSQ